MFRSIFLVFLLFVSSVSSEELKKVRFIINPKSGTQNKLFVEELIDQHLDPSIYEGEIIYTEGPQHATALSREAANLSYDLVVAVGGDGTVNEVAQGLIYQKTAMGIIPMGSGNGLARHLHIPTDPKEAIILLNHPSEFTIDTVKMNDKIFLGVAGVGFDAHIASKFASSTKRGFWSYAALILKEYPFYTSKRYDLLIDGKPLSRKALLLSFANSSQYGNNFTIAPTALLNDGFFEVVAVKEPSFFALPSLFWQFKNKTIDRSSYCETFRCQELYLRNAPILAHLDGEPMVFDAPLHLKIQPLSLHLLIP